ncbi:membrane protein [Marivirga tractuosa]|uniref:TonB-dependent receptor n=2 Tax=Marivirga TaxID=869806 RepID=E4TUK5_MARTH|nr:TonB-dependent receptor [Marivirga tractuosa DSM 4126]BDD16228.1 membrane protein [Marivirga tractuosa]
MEMYLLKRTALVLCLLIGINWQGMAQKTQISGTVVDDESKVPLIGVNVVVKGKVLGTTTDFDGNFDFSVNLPTPITLQFSMVGYKTVEYTIDESSDNPERQTGGSTGIKIALEEELIMGQEVVVSASRVEESILQSPVSIEKMDVLAIQQTPADNYYKSIGYLKGVDVTQSSINFQIVNARGFNSTGNTRFVQLTDGMDTQAPALNFPIGNLNGPSELDVESVEFIPGAQSALYGPNAFNGIMRVTSKSAFEYQGFSAFAKTGVNHIGADTGAGAPSTPQPMYEASVRYAKSLFNDRFAFKVNASYMKAEDWYATDYSSDRNAALQPDGFPFNPGSDAPNLMGDEAAVNLAILSLSDAWGTLAGQLSNNSQIQRDDIIRKGVPANQFVQNGFLPNQLVSATPFEEHQLIDYGAENLKANIGLYYRLNNNIEASYLWNAGYGTSIYTGAQRYSLKNFGIQQHRLQFEGTNWFVRGYATIENSGDSYITEFYAKRVLDLSVANSPVGVFTQDVSGWLGTYAYNYLAYLDAQGIDPNTNSVADVSAQMQQDAFSYARTTTEAFFDVDFDSEEGQAILNEAANGTVPTGPKFNDQSRMYHAEAQYDFSDKIEFVDLLVGGSFRQYDLRSNGTIFPDSPDNPITINEIGGFAQASKRLLDDKLKLIGSIRGDKNENFDAVFSPRLSGVLTFNKTHNIRASFQTGFRNPTTQGQFINLDIISSRLLGGLPGNLEQYGIGTDPNIYTIESVNGFAADVFAASPDERADPNFIPNAAQQLVAVEDFKPVAPEQVQSFEVGYKSVIDNKLMMDFVGYYNNYNSFIVQQRMRRAGLNPDGTPNPLTLLNGTADNTFQVYTNADEQISAYGFAGELNYSLPKKYTVGVNYNYNKLNTQNASDDFVFGFNTPEHKFNLKFGNRKLTDKLGFNVVYRWQSEFFWESSFGDGIIPAFGTADAQVSYKLPSKMMLKLGGSNLLNNYYIQSFGAPRIGAIYYVSITFDQLMN